MVKGTKKKIGIDAVYSSCVIVYGQGMVVVDHVFAMVGTSGGSTTWHVKYSSSWI